MMGCAASKAVPPPPSTTESVPKPVAFEISIEKPEEPSTIKPKKPPPQILQSPFKEPNEKLTFSLMSRYKRRLEEQNQNNLTVEELKEKQQKAEERRLTILEEKRRISRNAQKMFNKNGEEKENAAS